MGRPRLFEPPKQEPWRKSISWHVVHMTKPLETPLWKHIRYCANISPRLMVVSVFDVPHLLVQPDRPQNGPEASVVKIIKAYFIAPQNWPALCTIQQRGQHTSIINQPLRTDGQVSCLENALQHPKTP